MDRIVPTRVKISPVTSFEAYMISMGILARSFVSPGGSPLISKADQYMAGCITAQYKMSAVPTGVYSVKCTEGTVRGQAEDSRVMALAARFRYGQRSTIQRFGDWFSNRRMAVQASHLCSYEEKLMCDLPASADAMVTGPGEAQSTCVRYANAPGKVEQYMIDAIDKQYKYRAAAGGVYGVQCCDGTISGLAENKRVVALSTKYRAAQMSLLQKEQAKFDALRKARVYAGSCTYEEKLFNLYPSIATAMRPESVRY